MIPRRVLAERNVRSCRSDESTDQLGRLDVDVCPSVRQSGWLCVNSGTRWLVLVGLPHGSFRYNLLYRQSGVKDGKVGKATARE